MGCKFIFVFIFTLFLLGVASASFNFSEKGSSINNQYGLNDYLKAKINISFQNESLNSTFRDSLGNSIKLGTLLNRTSEYDYTFNDSTNLTINSGFHILEFDKANFSMPGMAGNFSYQLNFSGINLFKERFEIISSGNSVKEKIDEEYARLNASKIEIKKYDLSIQKILNDFLNMTSLENNLKKIETQYKTANSDAEYNLILENLSYINIPEEISENVNTNSIVFYPDRATINLDVLKKIAGGDYGENKEGYIDSIYLWNENNLNTRITFKEIIITYGLDEKTTLNIFKFEFDKSNMKNDAYFIVKEMSNLKFEGNYLQKQESGYIYINLNDISDKIIFSTTEDTDFLNVPAFISPSLNNLNITGAGNYTSSQENGLSKWVLFGVIIFILILIAIIAYIILQTWYRRKYENHLFKNRNNLYNIMTYIQNSKKKEMEKEEIMKNLKKAGWTREQINYAIRKYEGKKILGIIDRPFKKIIREMEKAP
jgi:hypothetical protein